MRVHFWDSCSLKHRYSISLFKTLFFLYNLFCLCVFHFFFFFSYLNIFTGSHNATAFFALRIPLKQKTRVVQLERNSVYPINHFPACPVNVTYVRCAWRNLELISHDYQATTNFRHIRDKLRLFFWNYLSSEKTTAVNIASAIIHNRFWQSDLW